MDSEDPLDAVLEDYESNSLISLCSLSILAILEALLELPIQMIWGSINALQLIAYVPLSEISLPAQTYGLFSFLATITSFNLFPLTKLYNFDISDT